MTTNDKLNTNEEPTAREWIAVLRDIQDHLSSVVQPLDPGALRGPSYHSWTIAEVLGHVGSQAELFDRWLTCGLERTEPPPHEAMQEVWDRWNAKTPDAKVKDSIEANEDLLSRFEALSDEELSGFHLDLFGMALEAPDFIRLRVAELAVHTWDVEIAVDKDAEVVPSAVALLVDTLGQIASYSAKPTGKPFSVGVRTSDPTRDFLLTVNESVTLAPTTSDDFDDTISMPTEVFVLLVYGRAAANDLPSVKSQGNVTFDQLRAIFQGV